MSIEKITCILKLEFINVVHLESLTYSQFVDIKRDKVKMSEQDALNIARELLVVKKLFRAYFKTTINESSDTHISAIKDIIECKILKKYVLLGRKNKKLIENIERGFNVSRDSLESAQRFINLAFNQLYSK